jgi:hypothetical protein
MPLEMSDVLDRETIDKIEELHTAVVREEAEQRFGLLRGKRAHPPSESEAAVAERALLDEHGLSSYNDYRLQIRRSSVAHVEPPRQATESDDDAHAATDRGMATDADPADPEAAVHVAAGHDEADNFAAQGLELRRRIAPLIATVQAETETLVVARIERAERQAAEIVNQATKEADEIVGRADRLHDAMISLVGDVTRQSVELLGLTEDLPGRINAVRDGVETVLRTIGDRATSSPAPEVP